MRIRTVLDATHGEVCMSDIGTCATGSMRELILSAVFLENVLC
jgi:hypothetical protein